MAVKTLCGWRVARRYGRGVVTSIHPSFVLMGICRTLCTSITKAGANRGMGISTCRLPSQSTS